MQTFTQTEPEFEISVSKVSKTGKSETGKNYFPYLRGVAYEDR